MIYYANGCSYTWGGSMFIFNPPDGTYLPELPDDHPNNKQRLELLYTHHLGKLLNAEKTINQSLGGASNYRIVRTTIDYFNNLLINDHRIDNHFVTIQWTDPSRIEFYDEFNKSWVHFTITSQFYEQNHLSNNARNLTNERELWYKSFDSDELQLYSFINQIITLGSFFQAHNIPYLFFHKSSEILLMKNSHIKYQKILNRYNWLYDNNMKSNITDSNIDKINNSHPSALGHQQWANILYDVIKKRKIV